MKNRLIGLLSIVCLCLSISPIFAQHSVAREWNELLLEAIRNDFARPTVHARNLFHTSIAMYDAWAIYDPEAEPVLLGDTINGFVCPFDPEGIPVLDDLEAAQEQAISYAAYRLLTHRFQNSPGAFETLPALNNYMNSLGYLTGYTNTNYANGNPAAMGNYIASCIIDFGLQDGSNEQNDYENQYYEPFNDPLIVDLPGNPDIQDPNRWQPLTLEVFIDQSGNVTDGATPDFLSPEWGNVVPFALETEDLTIYERDSNEYWVYHDPGPPPYLDVNNPDALSDEYLWGFLLVGVWSGHLSPDDGVMWDISPASIGNIDVDSLPTDIVGLRDFYDLIEGGDPGNGHELNPYTGAPYEPNMVPRGDYARVLAEFWADGPDSETPPGHWFTLLNYVSDHPALEKRFRGVGPILDDLEWDVKAYLTLGGTMHDVAITAWGIKGYYDYIRPVSALRLMADKGQSSDPELPSYNPEGIPLIPGHVELVLPGDQLAGATGQHIGKIKLYAWKGPDYITFPQVQEAGVDWILAEEWWPYQRPSFVTPNFAGYISGHSTYSRAAAEVLTMLTNDPFFPGGMGIFNAEQNEFLVFEDGPSQGFDLQWATYRDASDQCSLSRIWGGIHPPADDIPGRLIGIEVGTDAFIKAESYFYRDKDMDGFTSLYDCDDNNPNIYPGANELCDGLDNNCNEQTDEGLTTYTYYRDADNDGFGDDGVPIDTCLAEVPDGYAIQAGDCNDNNGNIRPDAVEVCDSLDNNCNGFFNEGLDVFTYYRDADNDGFGDDGISVDTCISFSPTGFVAIGGDCNDNNGNIHPNAAETCDSLDNNCNGLFNEGLDLFTYYRDADNDGFGDDGVSVDTCISFSPTGFVAIGGDCNDNNGDIHPDAVETCDSLDNNCNGLYNDGLDVFTYYRDADNDGFGDDGISIDTCIADSPTGFVTIGGDCNDNNGDIHPDAVEVCDSLDNNCNGLYNDGLDVFTYYRDADNDGFGDDGISVDTCIADSPTGFVTIGGDCNDNNENVHPDAIEICDSLDNNCNGLYSEGLEIYTYYLDSDNDSYGDPESTIDTCIDVTPDGYTINAEDCDDTTAEINPEIEEIPNNGIDEDCDGSDLVTSIDEIQREDIKIYPNPTLDVLNISWDNETPLFAVLYYPDGRIALQSPLSFVNDNRTINLGQLPGGIYFLRLLDTSGQELLVTRVVKW